MCQRWKEHPPQHAPKVGQALPQQQRGGKTSVTCAKGRKRHLPQHVPTVMSIIDENTRLHQKNVEKHSAKIKERGLRNNAPKTKTNEAGAQQEGKNMQERKR